MTLRTSSLLALLVVSAALPAFAGDDPKPRAEPAPKSQETKPAEAEAAKGITWFATWDQALAEAKRANRPILFTSAAPACGSVPGMW